jgi:serine/threonine protein phosphatase PrpC
MPSLTEHELGPGELLMLCTDGVHGVLGDDGLVELLRESVWLDDLQATAAWVCDTAIEQGSTDNCTCVLIASLCATDSNNTGVESNACLSNPIACNSEDHHA